MKEIILGIDNVYYFVEDVSRAVKFYAGILDLQVLDKDEHWATLLLGNKVRLGLHKADKKDFFASSEKRGGATLTLKVEDIDNAYLTLKDRGVHFLGTISRNPWGSHVAFTDPDGNLLEIRQGPR